MNKERHETAEDIVFQLDKLLIHLDGDESCEARLAKSKAYQARELIKEVRRLFAGMQQGQQ